MTSTTDFSRRARNLIDASQITGLQDCRLVFLDLEGIRIIRRLLSTRGRFHASYFEATTPEGTRTRVDDAKFDIIQEVVSRNLYQLLEENMSCGNDVVLSLDKIEAAILLANESGGCGGGGCGEGSGGAGENDDMPEVFVDDGSSSFPPLFDDRTDYLNKKCGVARGIIDHILTDLVFLKALNLVPATATLLAGAMLTPIPGDEIAAFLGFLLALYLSVALSAAITEIQDAINSDIEGLVCAIMDAGDTTAAQAAFLSFLSLTGPTGYLIEYFLTNASFNRLFSYGARMGGYDPCDCNPSLSCVSIFQGFAGTPDEFISEDVGPWHAVNIYLNTTDYSAFEANRCAPQVTFSLSVITGTFTPVTGRTDSFQLTQSDSTIVIQQQAFDASQFSADVVSLISETSFTVDVEVQ